MRRDLLWTNSLKQGLHVVEVREDQGVFVAVVRMHISLPHVLQVLLIVAVTVLSLVNRFLPNKGKNLSITLSLAGSECFSFSFRRLPQT